MKMDTRAAIAVIGGSGLYDMAELQERETVSLTTPFGSPSAPITIGTLRGKRVAFLPRHGIGHVYTPSTVPYRANIYALKSLGVRFIIAVNACGSLHEAYQPGHIVIPDQLFDFTRSDRGRSFFDTGLVAHISVADPFSPELNAIVADAVERVGGIVHRGGTYITIEGPRFSTRGESQIFRQWGCSIIGMTTSPEAFLAAEAEIAYTTMSHVTDYDVWHTSEAPVTVDAVIATMHRNLEIARQAIIAVVETLDTAQIWPAHTRLADAIITQRQALSPEMIERLGPIVSHYLK
jgi:5'-methylthioadenosine phosphorylase